MKTLVVIPAYQVAPYLKDVIGGVRKYLDNILVIDDGSTDNTGDIAGDCGVQLIIHDLNRGKGAALKTGFAYAIKHNYDAVITVDGDGQHDPEFIPLFFKMYEKTRPGMVIGSRVKDKADMSFPRRCSNFLTSRILSYLLKTKIEDSQCGYRLITIPLLKQICLNSDRYQMETEIIIKAVQAGFKVAFAPIRVIYGKNFPSSISHFTDTFRWIMMVLEEV